MSIQIRGIVPPTISDAIEATFPARLGWAVTQLWDDLPKQVQDQIKQQAVFIETGPPTVQLNEQIGVFLRTYAGKLG